MKQLFLLIPWMLISLSVTGQSKDENPYAIFVGNPYVAGCQNENKFIIENISDKSEVSKIEHNPITGQVELINSIDHVIKEIQLQNNESGWHSMDPLAEKHYSISPYVYCANNPVKYIDLYGGSITIVHRTGFLGLGRKETLTYESGNLYNADGSAYSGKVNGYLKSVMGALGNLNATAEGASWVSELQNSTNMFTIKSGDNAFVPNSPTKAGANLSEVQAVQFIGTLIPQVAN